MATIDQKLPPANGPADGSSREDKKAAPSTLDPPAPDKEASEELLRGIIENLADAVITIDEKGRIQSFSPSAEKLFGYAAHEITGQNVNILMEAPDARSHDGFLHGYIESGVGKIIGIGPREVTGRRKDGSNIPLELAVGKMRLGGERLFIGALRDIRRRKNLERALRTSEERFRAAFESTGVGMGIKNLRDDTYVSNEALQKMLGYSAEELERMHLRDILDPEVPADHESDRRRLRAGEILKHQSTNRYTRKDGKPVWLVNDRSVVLDEEGRPLLLVSLHQDITDRKQAEQKIAAQAALLEATFNNMIQGIATFGADGKLTAFNQKYGEIMGFPEGFLHLGMSREETLRPLAERGEFGAGDVESLIAQRIDEIHAGLTVRREYVRPDGMAYVHSRVPTPDGGTITTVTDITERRAAAEQLRQAQKMEVVGQLTGGVAHDFNNLLAIIQGNIELLLDEIGHGNEKAEAALRATRRGAELTQRLLAFSRRQPLHPRPTDLWALITGMGDLLRRTLGATIEITTATVSGLWPALADPGQVENALLNLAINARDAMPGGGRLNIACYNAHLDAAQAAENPNIAAGDYVVLAVGDTGKGMPPDVLEHAFEPFFTTKEVGKGSGLGLSMIYGFAKQSRGHVTMDSEEGKGTKVTLYLPRAAGISARDDLENIKDIPSGGGEVILVLEDDADICTLVEAMLGGFGYRVITAPSAAAATEIMGRQNVDLVLSDVVLPGGMNGPEFIAEANAAHPGLKVVFMSGYPAEALTDNQFLGGEMVLLNKPFHKRDLLQALHEALH